MSNNIVNVSDKTFEAEVLNSATPVLLDFWAEWCGPCKMIAPVLADIAEEYAGRLVVSKMNVDENSETPAKYGVRGIPTLLIIQNGQVKAQKVGALSKNQLREFVDANI